MRSVTGVSILYLTLMQHVNNGRTVTEVMPTELLLQRGIMFSVTQMGAGTHAWICPISREAGAGVLPVVGWVLSNCWACHWKFRGMLGGIPVRVSCVLSNIILPRGGQAGTPGGWFCR